MAVQKDSISKAASLLSGLPAQDRNAVLNYLEGDVAHYLASVIERFEGIVVNQNAYQKIATQCIKAADVLDTPYEHVTDIQANGNNAMGLGLAMNNEAEWVKYLFNEHPQVSAVILLSMEKKMAIRLLEKIELSKAVTILLKMVHFKGLSKAAYYLIAPKLESFGLQISAESINEWDVTLKITQLLRCLDGGDCGKLLRKIAAINPAAAQQLEDTLSKAI